MKVKILSLICFIYAFSLAAYRVESGNLFVSGGFGAHVNVVRAESVFSPTPKAEMPLFVGMNYALDSNFGLYARFMPQFSGGAFAMAFTGGVKYWFSSLNMPLVPHVFLGISPLFFIPTDERRFHMNIGFSPGLGVDFFVLADFLIGAEVAFIPAFAFINKEKTFEFAVSALLDVSYRI
jgi:hypothetical protein